MALSFTKGTLNPASTSLARDIRNAWVSAFSGKPNWNIVDAGYVYNIDGVGDLERTVITNSNGFSLMLANSTTLTDTRLFVYIGRTYDATNHILNRLAFNGTKSTPYKISIHDQVYDSDPLKYSTTTYTIGYGSIGGTWTPELGTTLTFTQSGMYMFQTKIWHNGAPNQYALVKVPDWFNSNADFSESSSVSKTGYTDIINDYYWWKGFKPKTIVENAISVDEAAPIQDNYITASPSQTEWSAHINNDYATLSVKTGGVNNGQWIHFGKATSIIDNTSITDSFPYFMSTSTTTAPTYGTQVSVLDSFKSIDSTYNIKVGADLYAGKTTIPPASITYFDKYSSNPTTGSLSNIYISRDNPVTGINNSTDGALRAKLQDIMTSNPTNAIWGDYAIVGAKTYMYIGGNTSTPGSNLNTIAGWAAIN